MTRMRIKNRKLRKIYLSKQRNERPIITEKYYKTSKLQQSKADLK